MRKTWVIAWREFNATVRTKAFVVGIVLMPILMCGSVVVSIVTERFEDRGSQTIAIVDRTPGGKIAPILQTAVEKRNAEDSVNKKTGERSSPEFKLDIVPPSSSDFAAIEIYGPRIRWFRLESTQRRIVAVIYLLFFCTRFGFANCT